MKPAPDASVGADPLMSSPPGENAGAQNGKGAGKEETAEDTLRRLRQVFRLRQERLMSDDGEAAADWRDRLQALALLDAYSKPDEAEVTLSCPVAEADRRDGQSGREEGLLTRGMELLCRGLAARTAGRLRDRFTAALTAVLSADTPARETQEDAGKKNDACVQEAHRVTDLQRCLALACAGALPSASRTALCNLQRRLLSGHHARSFSMDASAVLDWLQRGDSGCCEPPPDMPDMQGRLAGETGTREAPLLRLPDPRNRRELADCLGPLLSLVETMTTRRRDQPVDAGSLQGSYRLQMHLRVMDVPGLAGVCHEWHRVLLWYWQYRRPLPWRRLPVVLGVREVLSSGCAGRVAEAPGLLGLELELRHWRLECLQLAPDSSRVGDCLQREALLLEMAQGLRGLIGLDPARLQETACLGRLRPVLLGQLAVLEQGAASLGLLQIEELSAGLLLMHRRLMLERPGHETLALLAAGHRWLCEALNRVAAWQEIGPAEVARDIHAWLAAQRRHDGAAAPDDQRSADHRDPGRDCLHFGWRVCALLDLRLHLDCRWQPGIREGLQAMEAAGIPPGRPCESLRTLFRLVILERLDSATARRRRRKPQVPRMTITLAVVDGGLCLELEEDGHGRPLAGHQRRRLADQGLGTLQVSNQPGRGSRYRWRIGAED